MPLNKGFYSSRIEYLRQKVDFKLNWGYVTLFKIAHMDGGPIPVEIEYSKK